MANEVKLKVSMEGGQVVRQEIDGVSHSVGQMASGALTATKAMMGVFAGFAANQVIGKLVSVQREFDVLNSSLITVTGSSAQADREFAWIKQFAATTPYQLNEVTGAFVKMKALGLDASAKALGSYGNTASAMGKGLNQMIEAVADAATGEFERLKEFGIKAKQQGDQVSLTFQGVTTKIGNNAAEITSYLQDIGNNQFAGAMAQRAATLDGAISNLTDTWDELFRTVNTNNAGGFIYDSVTLASGSIKDAIAIMNAMSGAADANAKSTGAMGTVQEALALTFERVSIGAATVKMFLVQVGESMGALAAIGVQALQGNWDGVKAIVEAQRSSSRAALDDLAAATVRVLGARQAGLDAEKASQAAAQVNATASARLARQGTADAVALGTAHASAGKALKAVITDQQKAAKLIDDLLAKENGFNANFSEQWIALSKAEEGTAGLAEARAALLAQQPGAIAAEKAQAEAADANTKAVDALYDAQEKTRMQAEDSIKTARTTLEQIQFETSLLEMNTEQRSMATMERELERQGVVKGTQAYDAYIEKLREAMSIQVGKKEGIRAAEEMADAQKKAAEESGKYWEDALMRAFESGKGFVQSLWDTIKNTLKTQVLKVMVQGTMTATGIGAAGSVMADSGGSSVMGTVGDAAGIAGFGSNVIGGLGLAATGFGQAAAATFSNGLIAGFSTNMANVGVLAANGSWMTALGAVAPYLAVVALLIAAITSNNTVSATEAGRAHIDYTADGVGGDAYATTGDAAQIKNMALATDGLAKSYFATAAALGIKAIAGAFEVGSNTGHQGENPMTVIGANFGAGSYSSGEFSSSDQAAFALAASRAVLTALQASELPTYLSGVFDGMTAGTATQDQINNVLAYAQALTGLNQGLLSMPEHFQNLAALSYDATKALIGFSGGLEALQNNLGTYYTNFYSAEEQRLQQIKNINLAVGLSSFDAATATRESFRALVEAQDLTTESGQKTYAALLGVAGAFAGLTDNLADTQAELAKKAQSDANAYRLEELQYAQEINDRIQAKQTEIKTAWQGITDGIMTEVDRIRGSLQSGPESLAAAQAKFAIALAQTRAGDQVAGQSLPGLSQNLDSIALKEAGSLLDYQRIMGRAANSLAGLGGALTDQYGLKPLTSEADPMVVELRGIRTTLMDGFGIKPTNTQNPVVEELRQSRLVNAELLEVIKELHAESQSSAISNTKTAKLLDAVTQGGTTLRTKTIA